jgi:hypothetical protein
LGIFTFILRVPTKSPPRSEPERGCQSGFSGQTTKKSWYDILRFLLRVAISTAALEPEPSTSYSSLPVFST